MLVLIYIVPNLQDDQYNVCFRNATDSRQWLKYEKRTSTDYSKNQTRKREKNK
jgi:hypothetical protein